MIPASGQIVSGRVTAFAALTRPAPKAGVVLVALLAAWTLLARDSRAQAAAMLGALVLSPVLLLADIWDSPQLRLVHRHPLIAAVGAVIALAVVVGVAAAIVRRPALLALLAVFALPFRVPIQTGPTTSNLLVPLYLVVGAGSLAIIYSAWRAEPAQRPHQPGWVERLLALYVVLYGLQAIYSSDFEKALQQLVFFYVPFSLLFCLLQRIEWTPQLVRGCLLLVVGLAVVFAAIGFVEYETKTLLLNPKLVAANGLHAYFTVNSVFFDPDIFGRFLALVMIALAAVLLYRRGNREIVGTTVILAILWCGLVLTLSRSSLGALLVGLAVLAAVRWKAWPVVAAAAIVVAVGAAALAISPKTFGLNQGLNGASSGRAGLVSGGFDLFRNRPLQGYGSGSFVHEYRAHHPRSSQTLSASHTIPITIAAEQGLIGEVAYIALVLCAVVALLRGVRASPVRAAVGAAFVALVFHTMLYADFLEDPITWTLLGLGTALALQLRPAPEAAGRRRRERVPVPAA
jgi:putative inorganic carbon (hco3(-)) transporter